MASAQPFFLLKYIVCFCKDRSDEKHACRYMKILSIRLTTLVTVAIETVKFSSACVAISCSWYKVHRAHGYNHNATDFECEVKNSQNNYYCKING